MNNEPLGRNCENCCWNITQLSDAWIGLLCTMQRLILTRHHVVGVDYVTMNGVPCQGWNKRKGTQR